MFYRIRWFQPTNDYRSLTFPPNKNILGWWLSAEASYYVEGEERDLYVLVAIVKAETEEEAKGYILLDWPEADGSVGGPGFDFCVPEDINRPPGRFIPTDWMIERFQQNIVSTKTDII